MNPKISLLDPHCINQIAAGEVIERPLSVIKELVENSLDASAKKIDIVVEGRGTSLIRVQDDGGGIAAEDLRIAVQPHATSKIRTIEDLHMLTTLGFRGEALPSIASVSEMSILSRIAGEAGGAELRISGGEILSFTEKGSPRGTTVTVGNLFYNTPARRKFLSSDTTEFGHISDMVGRLAMARPDVAFSLRHPVKLIFNTPGKGNLLDVLAAVWGSSLARRLLPVSYEEEFLKITGYLSPPELSRSSRQGMVLIVNGRVIRSKLLGQAVKNGYHTLLPASSYPLAVLNLTIPPDTYDVNIHPAKLEIKFKEERDLSWKLSEMIKNALLENKPVKKIGLLPEQGHLYYGKHNTASDMIAADRSSNSQQLRLSYKLEDNNEAADNHSGSINPRTEQVLGEASFLLGLRLLGQLFQTYILAADEHNFYIIDQHAAHERIRYEKLLEISRNTETISQLLIVPETVTLTIQEEQIILAHLDEIRSMGFILEHFGDRTYLLRGVPLLKSLEAPGRMFHLFLDEILNKSSVPTREKLLEDWIFLLACRSAIKGGGNLTGSEMEELIQQLSQTANPYSCPHGRPVIVRISQDELERYFQRK